MSIAHLRDANAVTTQILVGRGIVVTQRGSGAYVSADLATHEPILLNLPFLPDDAEEALVDAVQGFIDHEAGHVLFTDWLIRAEAVSEGLASSHNLVEDCYVERSMADAYLGSAANLEKLHSFFVSDITPGLLREVGEDQVRAFEILVVPAVRALAGQRQFVDFMDQGRHWERPSLEAFLKIFGSTGRDRLPRLRSSADCLEVARLLEDAMRVGRAAADAAPPGTETGASEGASPASASGGDGDKPVGPSDGCGSAGGSSAKAGEGVSHEVGQRSSRFKVTDISDGVGGDGEDPTGVGGGRGGTTSAVITDDADLPSRQGFEAKAPGARGGGTGSSFPNAPVSDPFSSAVARAISQRAEAATAQSPYRIWSRDLDVIAPLAICEAYDDQWLTQFESRVSDTAAVLQRRFERAMAARSASRMAAGFKSGSLHAGSLHRIATGDDRLFRRRQEAVRTDAAISLLIDNSGSMLGDKMMLAMMAGYALTQTADRVSIACECLGFTTDRDSPDALQLAHEASGGIAYSRRYPLYLPIYKRFDERFSPLVRRRFAAAATRQWFCSENVDGESVAIAARRLWARREPRKVLIVLSDGRPSGGINRDLRAHLRATVKAVTRSGIELIGIGIGDNAVRSFYPRSIVLSDIEDLPAAVMRELDSMTGAGRTARARPETGASGVWDKGRRRDGGS